MMPHSALQSGQYEKWRTGQWRTGKSGPALNVDFGLKVPWDLEGLRPNTFFPMPASVVFASKCDPEGIGNPLARTSERWLGTPGANDIHREPKEVTSTLVAETSPYAKLARNGATIFPRALFFVTETTNPAIVQIGHTITVNHSQSQARFPGQNAMERARPHRHQQPDHREKASLRRSPRRDSCSLRNPGTIASNTPT